MRLRLAHPLFLGISALTLLPALPAAALPQSVDFMFSGEIVGGDNPGYVVNSSVNFSWDDACVGTDPPTAAACSLTVTLRAETTASGPMPSQGEVLSALVFDVLGSADFRDGPPGNVPWAGGSATALALEGSGAATALVEIGLNVSGHWGLNPAISVPGHGTHLLSSVGDAFGGGVGATLSTMQLFSATHSSVEPIPPDGSPFGIIDANSSSGGSGWPMMSTAYVQDELVAVLLYKGTLTGVDNVEPLYGTMGQPIPEPDTALLVALGLVGLTLAGRRQR